MQQPDNSHTSRSLVFITLTALVLCLAAGLALFSGSSYGVFAGVLMLIGLVPLSLLFLSVRASADESSAVRLSVDTQRQERSEERRVGKECSLTCRSRWSPYH